MLFFQVKKPIPSNKKQKDKENEKNDNKDDKEKKSDESSLVPPGVDVVDVKKEQMIVNEIEMTEN